MCEHLFALVYSAVEEGELLGVEFAGGKVGEVADLHRNFFECADDEAGNAPRPKLKINEFEFDRGIFLTRNPPAPYNTYT